jgi:hypothetical protein
MGDYWQNQAILHENRAGAALRELAETKDRYERMLAERDDLIIQLRADVLSLGQQVKNVNIEAGGNTTTNRIFSPGDGLPGDVGSGGGEPEPEQPSSKGPWILAGVGLLVWFLLKKVLK